ncbi:L-serine ammonia-lyase, iron-sulfur-dependent subunit beta [Anaerosacchariphilus polymeriproducens]|uniref:L-serine deaminase n=1 Tax=Anaerosacchariphilus polymeriproducens TaxID=1812858 RepID=A0A371AZR8_9FIRM|nr:L-serine ammonia-lyase, iron-sulfur-dependent subunit beta [Anaerosacchariphilus polymeriproducens]RDU24992.1 L-serine ammonia-lyase, iron-sulfur-dependent, subunit beta [Anaerosacchariphilus polymeriproducens]
MDIFDIIGPVMIGPSSSHTAGAVRIGRIAYKLLNELPIRAEIGLCGSFAQTYKGHGTDKALLAGIMNMHTDDIRIRNAQEVAKSMGIQYHLYTTQIKGAHPNTVEIYLVGKSGNECRMQGASVGGGNIEIRSVNGMEVEFKAQQNTLLVLHRDVKGTIAAVSNSVAASGMNIGNFQLCRPKKGHEGLMTIEVDGDVKEEDVIKLKSLPNVINVVLVRAL